MKNRAHSKLYLKFYGEYLWNSFFLLETVRFHWHRSKCLCRPGTNDIGRLAVISAHGYNGSSGFVVALPPYTN